MATKTRIHKDSPRTAKLRDLWLRATLGTITIPFPTESSARQARFQLYNAVRAVRAEPAVNPTLATAIEQVQVTLRETEAGGWEVLLERNPTAQILDEVFDKLGITGQEAPPSKTQEEVDMEGSLARIMRSVGEGGTV